MVRAKLEENGVEIEFKGSTPGVKAEMAFLLKITENLLKISMEKKKPKISTKKPLICQIVQKKR